MSKPIILEPRRRLLPFVEQEDGPVVGYIEEHPDLRNPSENCAGAIFVDLEAARRSRKDRPTWTVEQNDPLTLSPSVACRTCGNHGFIREGKWVPA